MTTWQEQAACRDMDGTTFFPEPERLPAAQAALAVCASCPVRVECLAAALGESPRFDRGVWGGFTAKERGRLRRLLNRQEVT